MTPPLPYVTPVPSSSALRPSYPRYYYPKLSGVKQPLHDAHRAGVWAELTLIVSVRGLEMTQQIWARVIWRYVHSQVLQLMPAVAPQGPLLPAGSQPYSHPQLQK